MEGAASRFPLRLRPTLMSQSITSVLHFTILASAVVALNCGERGRIEHRLASPASSLTVPVSVSVLLKALDQVPLPLPPPFSEFRLRRVGSPLFPEESQLRAWTASNKDLDEYLRIRPERRVNDFFLAAPEDLFWMSEFSRSGIELPFRSNFLVHLSPSPGGTTLSVFEFLPQVKLGKRFGFTRHGPGVYEDLVWVGPTNSDKQKLLNGIRRLLG
jgi:hypothetical protein